MICEIVDAIIWFGAALWGMPEGFATFLTALATLTAGLFVIVAARGAWRGVQAQIANQQQIEDNRKADELSSLKTALVAELMGVSRQVIQAQSIWNLRAFHHPSARIRIWPKFVHPHVYLSVIGKIGLIKEGWPAAATIGFYANLMELNEMATEPYTSPRTVNETNTTVAARLHIMSFSLAQALEGLRPDSPFPVPPEIDPRTLYKRSGQTGVQAFPTIPENLCDLLRKLAS